MMAYKVKLDSIVNHEMEWDEQLVRTVCQKCHEDSHSPGIKVYLDNNYASNYGVSFSPACPDCTFGPAKPPPPDPIEQARAISKAALAAVAEGIS